MAYREFWQQDTSLPDSDQHRLQMHREAVAVSFNRAVVPTQPTPVIKTLVLQTLKKKELRTRTGDARIAFVRANPRQAEHSLGTLRIERQAPAKTTRCKLSGAQLYINIAEPAGTSVISSCWPRDRLL